MFTEQTLQQGLTTHVFGHKIYTFDSIDSTNNCAKAVAGCGAKEGTIIFAEHQTAGKGRLGRQWQSNPHENLIFSIVLRPKAGAEALNLLPLCVAVAVAQALEQRTGLSVECKWPNDLLISDKKVAGILIESTVKQNRVENVVIGIGINVNQSTFGGELNKKATSLKIELGHEVDRSSLFQSILQSIESTYSHVTSKGFQSILPSWLSRTSMLNRQISVSQEGTVFSGIVKGLSNEGGLVLRTGTSEKTLFAGDVTIVGM